MSISFDRSEQHSSTSEAVRYFQRRIISPRRRRLGFLFACAISDSSGKNFRSQTTVQELCTRGGTLVPKYETTIRIRQQLFEFRVKEKRFRFFTLVATRRAALVRIRTWRSVRVCRLLLVSARAWPEPL